MVDCELSFIGGKYNIFRCLQKSFLHGDFYTKPFETTNQKEAKQYIKKIMINAIQTENNYFGDEYDLFAELLCFLISLEMQNLELKNFYCNIALG